MKKLVILIFLLFCFVTNLSFAEDTSKSCKEVISHARMKRITIPQGLPLLEFLISPDNKEVLFLLRSVDKTLQKDSDKTTYVLESRVPQAKTQTIEQEEGDRLLNEWKKAEGIDGREKLQGGSGGYWPGGKQDKITRERIHMRENEYWMYNIKESKWLKLDWAEGNELSKDWNKNQIKTSESPDGSIVFYKKLITSKQNFSILMPGGFTYIYGLNVSCASGGANKVFKAKNLIDAGYVYSIKWSSDGSFLIYSILGFSSRPFMIYFN